LWPGAYYLSPICEKEESMKSICSLVVLLGLGMFMMGCGGQDAPPADTGTAEPESVDDAADDAPVSDVDDTPVSDG
jgi:hypothetical protein